jgi:short-subunit dehydrogenase involved in D-alanine esterification of teichoic acids
LVSLVNANVLYDLSKEDYNRVRDSRNFTGKVVLVTGSNSGIGEGIAKLFSVLGAQVVITGRNETGVKRVAKEVQELSPNKLKVR